MIRITRLTDYGLVLLAQFARHEEREIHTGRDLAEATDLPLPTVSKLLKTLAREGILVSHRGVQGGYQLARHPEEISIVEIISALEGPIAVTLCSLDSPGGCEKEELCPVQSSWRKINQAVLKALKDIKLADMVQAPSGPCRAESSREATRRPPSPYLELAGKARRAPTGIS